MSKKDSMKKFKQQRTIRRFKKFSIGDKAYTGELFVKLLFEKENLFIPVLDPKSDLNPAEKVLARHCLTWLLTSDRILLESIGDFDFSDLVVLNENKRVVDWLRTQEAIELAETGFQGKELKKGAAVSVGKLQYFNFFFKEKDVFLNLGFLTGKGNQEYTAGFSRDETDLLLFEFCMTLVSSLGKGFYAHHILKNNHEGYFLFVSDKERFRIKKQISSEEFIAKAEKGLAMRTEQS